MDVYHYQTANIIISVKFTHGMNKFFAGNKMRKQWMLNLLIISVL